MKELSLHILDIVKNSVKAKATLIGIDIIESVQADELTIVISDNGCGMSKDFLARVRDPFTTTRTTRKVGMGIPLYEAAALQCDGRFDITSEVNVGTTVTAVFGLSHIDRAPLGDMAETMTTLVSGSPEIDFCYTHQTDTNRFVFDTREIRKELGEVPLNLPDVLLWIDAFIKEGLTTLTLSRGETNQ